MQAQLSRRFWIVALVVLLATAGPWLFYHQFLGQEYELAFGLDLKGGASITYRVTADEDMDQQKVLDDTIRVTQTRIDRFGVSEVNFVASGDDQFTVELPGRGKAEIDRIKKLMGKMGTLEFRILAPADVLRREREKKIAAEADESKTYQTPPGYVWYPQKDGKPDMLLQAPDLKAQADLDEAKANNAPASKIAELETTLESVNKRWNWTGEKLASASVGRNQQGVGYIVQFDMKKAYKTDFGNFTGEHIGEQMAIVLSGTIETAPEIKSKLPGGGQISSDFDPYTQETAQDLVTVLQSGSLEVQPEEISSFVVGPGLGEDAVRKGRIAIAISFLLVILMMAYLYRGAGWVANLALLLNLVMTLGILMFLNAALSLPGIAGLLLTLGMAVDANILVYERIREEKASGKGLLQAITTGYDRALVTIVDANLTTIITAGILYWIGTGPVRGFALTLILGLFISMFTALYVTRTLFLWGMEKNLMTEFRMATILGGRTWAFMGLRKKLMRASLAAIVLGTAAFALRPAEDKYDLEFTGGQRVVISMVDAQTIDDVRTTLEGIGYGEAAIRTIKGRGDDAEKLDLSVSSTRFEITARIKDEKEGAKFTETVEGAFQSQLLPLGVVVSSLADNAEAGQKDFSAVVNFESADVDQATVLELFNALPEFEQGDIKAEPADAPTGIKSFTVNGKTTASTQLQLVEAAHRAIEARDGYDLAEPVPQSDFIGPGVARRLRDEAMLAILLSIIVQILYLRFRFRDFTYGFAAAIALVHDVLVTLGMVALFDMLGIVHVKINLPVIAAFLTLIGYSMNDSIVVFDRIRENLGRAIHPDTKLLDLSINQTLARSIRTSVTTLAVALTLLIVNYGAASSLEGFAFVMSVGVVLGTYSSIAIASPLLLFLPVYIRDLYKLGTAMVWGLMVGMFAGLAMAFALDGVLAIVGAGLAALLPLHFAWKLIGWLAVEDADALLREAAGKNVASRETLQQATEGRTKKQRKKKKAKK
ncbi:MAG: protein translocase subunit SecD [Planctomycetota bacterium]|jgi:SecD/SecF fusion protein